MKGGDKMKTYVFKSTVYVEAESSEEAWEKFEYTLEADLWNECWLEEVQDD